MKKLLMATAAAFIMFTGAMAQKKPAPVPAPTEQTAKEKATPKKASLTKKDGTKDMRFKANKQAADTTKAVIVHKKKDGTADKRFKENKKNK
jgi:2-methylaconitate cis-trans-isomerase PrpF